jgi:hypothetical protein
VSQVPLRLWKFAGSVNDMVLALDHARWIGACRDVAEPNVVRNRTEEGDAFPNEHRQTTEDQTMNESGTQK